MLRNPAELHVLLGFLWVFVDIQSPVVTSVDYQTIYYLIGLIMAHAVMRKEFFKKN